MASTTFSKIGSYVINSTDLFSNTTIIHTYMHDIKPVAIIILTIFILWRLMEILLGSNKKPTSEILIEVLIWSIVWSLAFNVGGWLQDIQKTMNDVYEWVGGGKGFFKDLDTWWDILSTISSEIYTKDSSHFAKIRGGITVLLIGLAMIGLILPSLIIVTISYFTVQILVALSPFMILSYIFPSIKNLFHNWIELFLTNVLILLLISIFKNALLQKILHYLKGTATDAAGTIINESNMITASINILLMAAFFSILIVSSVPIAKALTRSFNTMGLGKGI